MNVPRRINLLFIVNSLRFGGAEKHVVTVANHLDPQRFRLSLIYLKDEDSLLPQLQLERLESGVSCCHVQRRIDLAAAKRLAEHINERQIDIVLCTNSFSLLYGWLGRLWSRRPAKVVEVFHSSEPGNRKAWLQMLFYRPFFMLSHLLIYVCENQRTYWRRRGLRARGVAVIHNGIDTDRFRERCSPGEKNAIREGFGFLPQDYVVGLCAAMRPEKAHGDLLEALSLLRTRGVDTKALLIGDGPERPRIEQHIARLGLEAQVRITGFMDDVRPAIEACDVMALVSHGETFSIAALEAMAMGRPMVMTDTGGAGEQVDPGRNGLLFPRGDIGTLAADLSRLADREERTRMGRNARSRVETEFSLPAMVSAYERQLAALVDSS